MPVDFGQEAFVQMHSFIAGGFSMLLFLGLFLNHGISNLFAATAVF